MATVNRNDTRGVTKSINAATAGVTGTVLKFAYPAKLFLMQVTTTGSPTGTTCILEGSLDGTTFYTMGTMSTAGGGQVTAVDVLASYVRARLTTLTGGTSPTASATIAWSV